MKITKQSVELKLHPLFADYLVPVKDVQLRMKLVFDLAEVIPTIYPLYDRCLDIDTSSLGQQSILLPAEMAFDSADRGILRPCLSLRGVPRKFISLI